MMSKPKYIVIFTGLFCSVVASGTSPFYSFFSVNVLAWVDFWFDNLGRWLGKQVQAKNECTHMHTLKRESSTVFSCLPAF